MRRVVASVLGIGLVPKKLWGSDSGAGTLAAAAVWGPAVLLGEQVGWWAQAAAALAMAWLSLWAVRPFAKDDPGWVVVDEGAGVILAVVGLDLIPAALAFVVFRAADITKWAPGVRSAERLAGSLGVTGDDLVAGAYALAAGWVVQVLL